MTVGTLNQGKTKTTISDAE